MKITNSIHIPALPLATFLISFSVFVLRRPDIVTNPSFWAEDGFIWFRQAYEYGALSLLWPQNGYFQSVSRLTALLSLSLPMEYAPLVFNIVGISIRSLFVAYILTNRMSKIPLMYRIFLCLYIVLMPGLAEVHANITNTHWYLSMWLLCLLLSDRPQNTFWLIHDIFLTFLAGLSGPFVVFLIPVFAMRICLDKNYRSYLTTFKGLLLACPLILVCAIQVFAVLMSYNNTRSNAPLGFSFEVIANILSARVFIGSFLTSEQIRVFFNNNLFNSVISIASLALLLYIFVKSTWHVKCIIMFASIMIFFALSKPMLSLTEPQLPLLSQGGERYFVITNIAWIATLIAAYSLVADRLTIQVKAGAMIVAALLIVSVAISNFSIAPLEDIKWYAQVQEFRSLPAGESYEFQLNPPSWKMSMKR